MITVISSTGDQLQANFDLRFGRAAWFCIYDSEKETVDFKQNPHTEASNGAGTKVAELVAEWKADKVISGDFGPKAKDLLEKLAIQMVILPDDQLRVEEIMEKLK